MRISLNRIHTKDGLELVGLLYEPDIATEKILVHVHGMAGNFYENKFLDYIAKTLTDSDIAFFSFNNRGCEMEKDLTRVENGKRSFARIGDAYERFEDCVLDIQAAVDFAEKQGYKEIHLSGHSLGGPKVAYYASKAKDSRLRSLIFISPADMVGLAKMDSNYMRDMELARTMVEEGKSGELLPELIWGENYLSANTFLDLSDESSSVNNFALYDPKNKLEAIATITLPMVVLMGKKDSALTVPIEDLMKRVRMAATSSKNAETEILGEAGHDYFGFEQLLADSIKEWIQEM